jgi:ACT domain-containing protein
MLVETKDSTLEFNKIKEELKSLEEKIGVKVYVQHEDIFKAMHRI